MEHTKGTHNPADGLSRVRWPIGLGDDRESLSGDGLEGTINSISPGSCLKPRKDLVLGQLTDVNIQRIKSILNKHSSAKSVKEQESNDTLTQYIRVLNQLTIENELLCKVEKNTDEGSYSFRICVPSKLIGRILTVGHRGHPGVRQTYLNVKQNFYWPYQRVHTEQFVASCAVCAGKANYVKRPKIFFKEIIGKPNFGIQIDFVGPLTTNIYNGKNVRYIVTMVDTFSRYLVAVPTEGATSKDALHALLNNWVSIFGMPYRIHSDRGSHFTSHIFRNACKQLGILKTSTIGYNPTGNAKVERVHGTVKPTLRGLDGTDWAKYLASKVFYYNISINRMTNFSPFELFFGRLPGLPVDLFLPGQGDSALSGFDRLRSIEADCCARSEKLVDAERKIRFKFQGHKVKYEPGDLVWYYKPTAGKLRRDWDGPYKVTQKINDTVIEISDMDDKRIKVLIYKMNRM